ncbi:uncharacterized protein N7511_008643 [Penicillium nucicola]|uniref:uncharacterized protein n=1 Tax=Penicillium nucicola TaxID=1850975 RepID=UPI0025456506|nr:uncharacterized protein N7511_008643 [Penicillium nucicola]KAJ5746947.1 hypothetical protein N7511_008643 [Penicillium nucicola]
MTTSWPEHTLNDSKFNDVFQLAQIFELHCAKVYDHAATHPDGAASAEYVMQLVSQAYRAVHSLHMQKMASTYLDMSTATAALESKAMEYRESRTLSSADENKAFGIETKDETTHVPDIRLEDLLNEDFDEEDDDEDSNWEESEEDTDDEYYEYCSGSDLDSELEELAMAPRIEVTEVTSLVEEDQPSYEQPSLERNTIITQEPVATETPTPTPISFIKDQAMHDRITAALQSLSIPNHEPNEIPLAKVETQIDNTANQSTPPTDDANSEATTIQIESSQEMPLEDSATVPDSEILDSSIDPNRLRRNSSIGLSSRGFPRRLRTVCYKFVGKAMVPIRGRSR